jgi:hypothetical protein
MIVVICKVNPDAINPETAKHAYEKFSSSKSASIAGYYDGTEEELQALVDSGEVVYIEDYNEAQEYLRIISKRIRNYPTMEEQMDMQYHDLVNGTTTWKETIQAVKDAHPKPE